MSKFSKPLALAALMAVSTAAHAEFIGLEVGIAGWQASPSGWVEDEKNASSDRLGLEKDLHLDKETAGFAWLRVVHPLPLLPNLKLNYTPLKFDGSGTSSFDFKGQTFTGAVDSKAEFNQLDVILFYNLLDTVVSVDAGLNIKVLDGSVKATERVGGASEDIDFTAPIPMLYGNVGFNVPTTNVKLGLEGSAIGYSGHRLTDFKASVRYTFIGVLGVEAGYRALNIKIDDLKDVSADVKVKGPYLGVAARF